MAWTERQTDTQTDPHQPALACGNERVGGVLIIRQTCTTAGGILELGLRYQGGIFGRSNPGQ